MEADAVNFLDPDFWGVEIGLVNAGRHLVTYLATLDNGSFSPFGGFLSARVFLLLTS